MVELRGFEPLTFCMPCRQVSSDGVVLGPIAALHGGSSVRGRLARSGEIWGRWYLVWSWFAGTLHEYEHEARPERTDFSLPTALCQSRIG